MNDSPDDSTVRALHRLVEHYTPDGALGRTLLGGTALTLAPFLFFGGIAVLGSAGSFGAFVMGLFAAVFGIPAFLVGVLALWPVYLSLIGNVESASAYPDGAAGPAEERETAEDILKRRYAAGELSQKEFEHRLDSVLATADRERDSRPGGRSRSASDRDRDGRRERDARRERSRSR